jgi:hypothetical protein
MAELRRLPADELAAAAKRPADDAGLGRWRGDDDRRRLEMDTEDMAVDS